MKSIVASMLAVLAASLSGCASSGQPGTDVPAAAVAQAAPCSVELPESATEPWRVVRGRGFTFCVPASWRAVGHPTRQDVDARTWRGGGGSITWGTGEYRPQQIATETVIVRAGDPLPAPSGSVRRFNEVIDGRSAKMWDNEFRGRHYTGAVWTTPAVYMEGEASAQHSARLQLAVFRTVRFTR